MSIRSVLKSFFETGDKPTEAEFADFIDSDYNLDDDDSDVITEGSANLFNQTHSGDATGSTVLTLANTAVTPGTYSWPEVTVDSKGRITSIKDAPFIDLYMATSQTFEKTTGTNNIIEWDGQNSVGSIFTHSTSVNPGEIQVSEAGRYTIRCNVYLSPVQSAPPTIFLVIRINGGSNINQGGTRLSKNFQFESYNGYYQNEIDLTVDDYIECMAFISFSSSTGTANYDIQFSKLIMRKIGQ